MPDLGVVVVDSGGADQEVRALHGLGLMPHGDRNPQGAQMGDHWAVLHVASLDLQPHAVEHFSQRGHGDPANAAQMDTLPGMKIFLYAGTHRCSSKKAEIRRYLLFCNSIIII